MAESDVQRKLTAILVTDVVGYSRLMGDDPEGTLKTLTEYREVFSDKIQEYKGRVVNAPGDSLLADFTSVLDAVSCAVDIQRELAERNQELPDERRMDFRIGVNLGDVLVKDGDIYGDGVNVAARLESLAEPGGICISGSVHEQVKARLPLHYDFIGEQRVKNISEPVKTYRVLSKPGAAAHRVVKAKRAVEVTWKKAVVAVVVVLLLAGVGLLGWNYYQQSLSAAALAAFEKEAAFPLPDRPSIAVLAFDNLTGDPAQEYFSDGLTEDIITKLASLTEMFVIARTSSFQYKGKQVDVRRIGRELGVRYVLEGSVQKSGERVRITAQLIDAATGEHLFAKRYDRELKDIFAVQNEIAYQVLAELHVKLGKGEAVSRILRSTNNFEAFDAFMRAVALTHEFKKEANFKAEELLLKAIELDPKFASAMGQLGVMYMQRVRRRWASDPNKALRLSADWARRTIEADPNNPIGLRALSRVQSRKGNHEEAIALGERAAERNPSDANAHMSLTWTYLLALQPEAAVQAINKAIRLAPNPPILSHLFAGVANRRSGRHEAAVSEYKKVLAKASGGRMLKSGLEGLVITYMKMGEEEQAKAAAEKLIKAFPGYTISGRVKVYRGFAYKNFDWFEEIVEILRKVGLPE